MTDQLRTSNGGLEKAIRPATSSGNASHFPLTRYGWREIIVSSAILVAAASVALVFYPPLAIVPVLLLVFVLSFFRDPERAIPSGDDLLVSPADGKVVEIAEVDEPDFLHGRALRIGIFLSVFNVHVNRAPCAGVVREVVYKSGRFRNALFSEASAQNENNAVVIDRSSGRATRIVVKQIAGAIARRIVCACGPGDRLEPGQRIGMIKFGSRTELYVPLDVPLALEVRLGQRVKGGSTIVGRIR